MVFDLMRGRYSPFSLVPFSSLWDEDEGWMVGRNLPSGLSISEDDKHVYVEAALPGIDPDDIDVTFDKGYVWIKGEAKEKEEDKKRKWYHEAVRSFSYRAPVPGDIDLKTEPVAHYKNGVMTVSFLKAPKSQPKKIQIKTSP